MSEASFDPFRCLGLPRRPRVDKAELQTAYLKRAKEAHPDQQNEPNANLSIANDEAAAINRAYQILGDEVAALRTFLELESDLQTKDDRSVPSNLVDLFMKIGPLFQEADKLSQELENEQSAILKARLHVSAAPLMEKLDQLTAQLIQSLTEIRERLQQLDTAWCELPKEDDASKNTVLSQLTDHFRSLSFLQRWQQAATEKSFRLTPM